MRRMMVAGNWKMNLLPAEGKALATEIASKVQGLQAHKQVCLCPTYISLEGVGQAIQGTDNLFLGAQNCHDQASGAFTGEISLDMLQSVGVSHVIIGHSERREYQNETDELLARKVDAALAKNMTVIFCCGEPLAVRDANTQNEYVGTQIHNSLGHLSGDAMKNVLIAYEPIWAIGTGRTASSEQAQEMHAHIRKTLESKFGIEVANSTSILYGGSCKASNAPELFACADVDGGLIGGAALKSDDFLPIIEAMIATKN